MGGSNPPDSATGEWGARSGSDRFNAARSVTAVLIRLLLLMLLSTAPLAAQSRLIQVVNGQASWYGPGFYGRRTASGETLRRGTFTAAHRTLPFGTLVRVTNLSNGRSVVVRINDRGPHRRHRVIDLAHGAASELRMMQAGEVPVRLEVIE
ncbi:septal ring lytic transglycosylase RlpA family protein [Synechococcus sp. CC9616]|uniref:septal ring lytic transglycosylase RlpA family protein n=1 Tax=Synechococcus sp. CC9616 TaxID=110663 RepID=UPI000687DF27